MRIESFRVVNYKSFADSGEIHLKPGFNVIVGRNNVGKTALAEAMSLRFLSKPHRSLNTVPTPSTPIDQSSRAEVSIRSEANELVDLLIRDMPTFYVPTVIEQHMTAEEAMLRTALSEGVTVRATFINGGCHYAQLSTYAGPTPPDVYLRFTMDRSGNISATGPMHGAPSDYSELAPGLAVRFHERLYIFSAVRFGINENPISTNRILAPDAANLVQVLDLLSRNPSRWQRYLEQVMVLALSTVLMVLTMAFSAAAFAHDPPGASDHGDHSRAHSEGRPTSGKKQQASHSEEAPPAPWLPVAFTLSGAVVVGGLVVILRRS